jgi:hypothetical protein
MSLPRAQEIASCAFLMEIMAVARVVLSLRRDLAT